MEYTLPEAGKTPTTLVQGTDLAVAVDGGNGDLGRYSTPSHGLHVSLVKKICNSYLYSDLDKVNLHYLCVPFL